MAKAYSDSIPDQMGSDLDEAFEKARLQHRARREAAQAATARAARWGGFVRDPGYTDTLVWRSVSLAQAKGAEESAAEELQEAHATMKRLSARSNKEEARIFGHVESPTGGGEADLIDSEGCTIATSPIDKLGYYAVVTEATGESARIEIRDAQGQLAVLDGRPVELTPGLMARRDFTSGRCGKVEPAPGEPDEQVEIPDLIGETAADARAALGELGDFRISYDESYSDDAPAETVIAQAPDPGRTLMPGGLVLLGISLGPEPQQTMPDLVGRSEEEARKGLAELRYSAVQFSQVVDRKNAGRVVKQTPEAGAAVGEDTEIRLCMGVAARLMPDLVGRTRKEALEVLVPDYVDAPTIREEPGDGPADIVLEQDPKAGEAVGDARVTLVISIGRREEENGEEKVPTMPDVSGKTRAQALKLLKAEGIEEAEFDEKAARRRGARVVEQTPPAGKPLKSSLRVKLTFAKPE
ncbi:PASTA domain-containing protein [Halomonas stenophila]|uniref:Beta-lactam-binding protein with PASTA domain n=1 Tax=Halomonas stenophila TaxID=795312 RepID=A0A7W5EWR9_9GAMM|nr:PASTA domain-containing protein [Halomonas stenophila]MBB3232260.1 beta-lactam-binding protein with PASTA domain [Halomonas stenophila]